VGGCFRADAGRWDSSSFAPKPNLWDSSQATRRGIARGVRRRPRGNRHWTTVARSHVGSWAQVRELATALSPLALAQLARKASRSHRPPTGSRSRRGHHHANHAHHHHRGHLRATTGRGHGEDPVPRSHAETRSVLLRRPREDQLDGLALVSVIGRHHATAPSIRWTRVSPSKPWTAQAGKHGAPRLPQPPRGRLRTTGRPPDRCAHAA
jgi:hypothetical protein